MQLPGWIDWFITHGAPVEGAPGQDTPLERAVDKNRPDVVTLLLQRGARKSANALKYAKAQGYTKVLAVLEGKTQPVQPAPQITDQQSTTSKFSAMHTKAVLAALAATTAIGLCAGYRWLTNWLCTKKQTNILANKTGSKLDIYNDNLPILPSVDGTYQLPTTGLISVSKQGTSDTIQINLDEYTNKFTTSFANITVYASWFAKWRGVKPLYYTTRWIPKEEAAE